MVELKRSGGSIPSYPYWISLDATTRVLVYLDVVSPSSGRIARSVPENHAASCRQRLEANCEKGCRHAKTDSRATSDSEGDDNQQSRKSIVGGRVFGTAHAGSLVLSHPSTVQETHEKVRFYLWGAFRIRASHEVTPC